MLKNKQKLKVLGIVFLFATNSDKTSFYDVYNITNFDKLSKIKKDALKNLNFNVAITDSNKKNNPSEYSWFN